MIMVITEYSNALKELKKLPSSVVVESVLDKNTILSTKDSLYGSTVNLIYVYKDFFNIKKLKLSKHKGKVVFVCDVKTIYLFARFIKKMGLSVTVDVMTKEQIVSFVADQFMCSHSIAHSIAKHFGFNISAVLSNIDAVADYLHSSKTLSDTLMYKNVSYTEALLYLCGDAKVTQDMFLMTICKYRYSNTHIIAFIRRHLKLFIELYFDEFEGNLEESSQEVQLIRRMSHSLNIDRALSLYNSLRGKTCHDLLKVVFL